MSDAVNNPTTVESTPGTDPVSTDVKPDKGEQQQQPKKLNPNKKEGEDTAENEIKVAAKGQIKNYLGYAFRVLNKTDHRSLKIRATGNAIVKALILIELVKRRVGDLHQINQIYSMEIVTYEETKIEGQEMVPSKRRVTAMDTVLSKDPLDTKDPGYQQPEPKDDTPMVSNQPKKEKTGNKKTQNQNKQKKLYNDLPVGGKKGEEETTKGQRQDRDKQKDGKHEQDKDGKKQRGPRNKDDNNETRGDRKERGNKRGMDPKSRKDNLRNLINDDEFEPRNKDNYRGDGRGSFGQQRGRGGNRGRGDGRRGHRGGPPMQEDGGRPGGRDRGGNFHDRRDGGYKGPMDNNYGPPYRMRQQQYEDEDHHYRNMRAYDDFNMHKPGRGAGPRRRGGPEERYYMQRDPRDDRYYNNGPPPNYGMRQGGPRERFNDNYDPYYGGPPSDMRQYGPPGGMYNGPPQMRGGRDGQFQPRPRGGQGPPPMDGERRNRDEFMKGGPPGDMEPPRRGHGPPPMRARGSGGRGDYRGGRGGEPPEGMMRGMGRGSGPPRGGFDGPPMRGGDMGRPQRARGSRGGPDRGGRGNFQGRPQDDEGGFQRDAGPKIHTRSRGGGQQQI